MTIKIGCCGWAGDQKSYFEQFEVIEIQQSFYQLPQVKTAVKWREAAQAARPGFEFTLKAWQLITHSPHSPTYKRLSQPIPAEKTGQYGSFRPTPEVFAAWERTAEFARALGARRVVFQCPASFRPTTKNLEAMQAFFSTIKRYNLQMVWEPRGDWPEETIRRLCSELHLVHCVDPFQNQALAGEIRYYRLHGTGGYDYRYSDEELARLLAWTAGAPETFVMFNNVPMRQDARRFQELVENHLFR